MVQKQHELEWLGIRISKTLKRALREDAAKSGWSLSEQVRYELAERRGLYRMPHPYLPQPATSEK